MKTIKLLSLLALTAILFSCEDDDNTGSTEKVGTVSELEATYEGGYTFITQTGEFAKFDLDTHTETTGDDWDIAFRGTAIIVNGGESVGAPDEPARTANASIYITEGLFDEVDSVEESEFKQDSTEGLAITTGSGNGWYLYDATTHLISPIPGKILVVKTSEGKYAKIEISNYYNSEGKSPYYSFIYSYDF